MSFLCKKGGYPNLPMFFAIVTLDFLVPGGCAAIAGRSLGDGDVEQISTYRQFDQWQL